MPHADEPALLASLPAAIAKPLSRALAATEPSPKRLTTEFAKALQAVQFPMESCVPLVPLTDQTDGRWRGLMPLPSELTPPQRVLADILAYRDGIGLYVWDQRWQLFSLPESAANRRRWLGLDPGGPLEENLEHSLGGVAYREPVWRALQRALRGGRAGLRAFFTTLPADKTLRALGALVPAAYGLDSILESLHEFWDAKQLSEGERDWAVSQADRLLQWPNADTRAVRFVVFLALARARVPIESRWERLLPFEPNPNLRTHYEAWSRECVEALPESRREAAILASIGAEREYDRVSIAFGVVQQFPYAGVARAVLDGSFAADLPRVLATLDGVGQSQPAVREVVAAFRTAQPKGPIVLRCADEIAPTSVDALSEIQRMQLEAFGRAYDGRRLSAAERLAPGVGVEEGSMAGFLRILNIDDEHGSCAYDAFLALDSGSIFRSGTTDEVAAFIQGSLDQCKEPRLADALKKAFAARKPVARKAPRTKAAPTRTSKRKTSK